MAHTTSDKRRRIGKKQRKRIPIIRSPVGPSKRKPTRQERFPSRAHPEVGIGRGRQLESIDPLRDFTSEEKDIINKKFKKYQEELLRRRQSPPTIRPNPKTMEIKKGGKVMKKKGGKVLYKRHGGMSHVGLSPAEEARAGTMSETERARYMRGGGPIHTTFSKRAAPRTEGREPEVDLFPKVKRKKSGKVYRNLGGKVTNGNDVTKMIYD